MVRFEWNDRKAAANERKHGISFEEAQSVFFDERAIEYADPDHSRDEQRFLMLGRSHLLRILVVCHCIRQAGSVIRIISARKATPRERIGYARRKTR